MAYDKKKVYDQAIKVIDDKKLFFIEDIIALLPISKDTFYKWWPVESNEYDTIKGKIENNKVAVKVSIRAKLMKGKGMELIALYKLLANEHELKALQNRVDHTTGGDKLPGPTNIINLGCGEPPKEESK